jgi:hypothetical protein
MIWHGEWSRSSKFPGLYAVHMTFERAGLGRGSEKGHIHGEDWTCASGDVGHIANDGPKAVLLGLPCTSIPEAFLNTLEGLINEGNGMISGG